LQLSFSCRCDAHLNENRFRHFFAGVKNVWVCGGGGQAQQIQPSKQTETMCGWRAACQAQAQALTVHQNGLIGLWTASWRLRQLERLNPLWHCLHSKGRSSECVRLWRSLSFRDLGVVNIRSRRGVRRVECDLVSGGGSVRSACVVDSVCRVDCTAHPRTK
jgi:hypothetical protein